jgi:hypothetical protein
LFGFKPHGLTAMRKVLVPGDIVMFTFMAVYHLLKLYEAVHWFRVQGSGFRVQGSGFEDFVNAYGYTLLLICKLYNNNPKKSNGNYRGN